MTVSDLRLQRRRTCWGGILRPPNAALLARNIEGKSVLGDWRRRLDRLGDGAARSSTRPPNDGLLLDDGEEFTLDDRPEVQGSQAPREARQPGTL